MHRIIKSIPSFLFTALVMLSACENKDETPAGHTSSLEISFNNNIFSGDSSQATGTFTGIYDNETKVLSYSITFSEIRPTAIYFIEKETDSIATDTILIPPPYVSPLNRSTNTLTKEQETGLLEGKWSAKIFSASDPEGAIRTRLFQNTILFRDIVFTGDRSTATGTFNGSYDKTTKILHFTIIYYGMEASFLYFNPTKKNPAFIYIHQPYTSPITQGTSPLTMKQETDLLAGRWSVNIKSFTNARDLITAHLIPD